MCANTCLHYMQVCTYAAIFTSVVFYKVHSQWSVAWKGLLLCLVAVIAFLIAN